ncbi:hypothetical protein [Runella aurantiaca]|uniref:Uncharacterized protein n=1 Tax=Runella aurantiaca TaxID=2282308 RepID=A0A369I350_9BACT|nr:hypothetical protein [Runella aurantiaca]RDB04149.1 hypothetical protein DVG78_20440 [Runella aurantiaca]
MKKHPIDKLFAQKLKEAEIKPRDEAWDKLQLRMQQNKKRRIGGWWQQGPWLAAAGVCLLLVAGWLTWRANSSNETHLAQHTHSTKAKAIEKQVAPKDEIKMEVDAPLAEQDQVAAALNKSESIKQMVRKNTPNTAPELKSAPVSPQPMVATLPDVQKADNQAKPENAPEPIVESPRIIAQTSTHPEITPGAKTVVLQLPELKETLVAANAKETIVEPRIKLDETKSMSDELEDDILNKPRKSTRMAKVWKQLKNAKNGERVDWDEVGFNPNKMLAKATGKERN